MRDVLIGFAFVVALFISVLFLVFGLSQLFDESPLDQRTRHVKETHEAVLRIEEKFDTLLERYGQSD